MDRNQARQSITELFTQPFDRNRYQFFLNNLLNHYEPRDGHYTGNYIPDAFKQHVNQYWRIGKYVDPQGGELDLLVVEVKSLSKLERARSSLRNFAVNRLKQFEKEASLIAFYSKDDDGADWRFSFVKIEHEAYRDDKGKIKLKQELTPAKRYSYLVGVHENSHTASRQLLPLLEMDYGDPRIDEIEVAFSIEKVTGEFFDQYKALFEKLAEHLKRQTWFTKGSEEDREQRVSRFVKKLLGQIVFLYFLQKKGWLGVPKSGRWGEGSKRFMRKRYDRVIQEGDRYYHDFLQYLFYEALADERKEQSAPGYYARFDCRVPFLNGGLFEADYDWRNESIDLPNALFHNDEKTKAGDDGTGILDVFDRYNFTMKEDEPLEKEVAVDPEMLGKVFENMLEFTERKSKGAYYTPREIVHYMCQESLIHYLDKRLNPNDQDILVNTDINRNLPSMASGFRLFQSQTVAFSNPSMPERRSFQNSTVFNVPVPAKDIETLIRKGHLALENDTRVISRGKETDTYKFQLPEAVRQHAEEIDEALADIKVCDPAIGSGAFPVGLLHEIVNARLALAPHSGNENSAYELKRHAIAESLYGVDIDASAIDIARLRLWLSLIVDEEDYGKIEALPNLDYKIVCGDSLIGFPENWKSPAFDRIEGLKKQFFAETDHNKKAALKTQIDREIQQRLDDSTHVFGWRVDFDFRLMFSEVWHQKGGFDVVIGNPPYVQIQKFSGQAIQKGWEKQKYETFAKTGDIYCLFYEKGHRLLRYEGVLAFITSNKWMRAGYGEKLRRFFSEKTQPLTLIDFSSFQVFETATVDTNVLLFRKQKGTDVVHVCLIDSSFSRATPLDTFVLRKHIELDNLSGESWVISGNAEYAIKKRIEQVGTPLKEWDVSINYGIKTGFNEAFIIDGKKKDELIAQDPKSAEIIKPILRGRDIKRYRMDFADLWLIATFPALNVNIDKYPAVRDYLKSFGRKLHQTGEVVGKDEQANIVKSRKKTGNKWFETQDQISYYEEFEKKKLVWADLSRSGNSFVYDERNMYPLNTGYIMTGESLLYLLAVLNSTPILYYLDLINQKLDKNGWRWIYQYVEKLPIPKIKIDQQIHFENLTRYIPPLLDKNQKLHSAYFEQLIDGLVYELYFPDEIKAANKEILPHLGELTPINDYMADAEKLAIIQREFNRLHDPRHPVRNHLESLDNVAVVGTIREALKR
ncbi:MAG: Eco57I restriction-modification methylase domain-containing protein [Methylococcales bacterium]